MPDAALDNAMARRSHMVDELNQIANDINGLIERHARVRSNLEEVENFIKMWHDMAGILPPQEIERSVSVEGADGSKRIRPKNPPRETVAEACVNYIRGAGRPLMRADLLDQLTKDGIVIRGKDPAMVLSTMLWRSKGIIRRLPEGGYWPAGQPTPTELQLEEIMGSVEFDL
jgi:hypothetical protein